MEENKSLKSKLQVAEAVQRQTNSAEQDYEEVIQLLEAEIKDLKNQLAGKKQRGLEATKVNLPHHISLFAESDLYNFELDLQDDAMTENFCRLQ